MRSFIIIASIVVFTDGNEIETYLHKCQRKVLGKAVSQIQFFGWEIIQDTRCAPLRQFPVCLLEWEPELLESGEILQELSVAARKLSCPFNVQKLARAVVSRDYFLEPPLRILESPFDHVQTTNECRSILIAQAQESATRILTKEILELRLEFPQPDNHMSFWKKSVYDLISSKLPILGWICDLNIEQLLRKEKQERLESFKLRNYLGKTNVVLGIDKSGLFNKANLERKDQIETDDTALESVNRNLETFWNRIIDNVIGTIPDFWSESIRYDNITKNEKDYLMERNKKPLIEEALSWGSGEDENDDEDSGKENEGFTSGEGQSFFDWSQDYDSESHKNNDPEVVSDYDETKNEPTEEKQPIVDRTFETEQNTNVRVNSEYTPFRSWWMDGESHDIDGKPNTEALPSRMRLDDRNGRIYNQVDEDNLDTDVKNFAVYLTNQAQKQSDGNRKLTVESELRLADLQGEHQRYHPGSVTGGRSNLVSTFSGQKGNSCTVSRMQVLSVVALVLLALVGI